MALTQLQTNWEGILETLARLGKSPDSVKVIGVTKKQPLERIAEGLSLGITSLGNNYVQEGEALRSSLQHLALGAAVDWHFIGHVQSRKAKSLGEYALVQSVDRFSVAEVLSRNAAASGKSARVLLEINIGREAGKSGVLPEDVVKLAEQLVDLSALQVEGLMCLPPPLQPVVLRRPYFDACVALAEQLDRFFPLRTLSMGTSEDYPVAIAAGATMIRLGSCLYGGRDIQR